MEKFPRLKSPVFHDADTREVQHQYAAIRAAQIVRPLYEELVTFGCPYCREILEERTK